MVYFMSVVLAVKCIKELKEEPVLEKRISRNDGSAWQAESSPTTNSQVGLRLCFIVALLCWFSVLQSIIAQGMVESFDGWEIGRLKKGIPH